mmetsp:Transcript_33999/g.77590  ORF Transcript_33999/g.77590 Transcript_33999/m.77590 type:complete len:85 (+) Transcript_33999:195-449(+)
MGLSCFGCGSSSELNKAGQGVAQRAGVAVGVSKSDGADTTTWEPASAVRSLTTHWMQLGVPVESEVVDDLDQNLDVEEDSLSHL